MIGEPAKFYDMHIVNTITIIFDCNANTTNVNSDKKLFNPKHCSKCCVEYIPMEEELMLGDCLFIAKNNGYQNGAITVLAETSLGGSVYRYGNNNRDEWEKIGKLNENEYDKYKTHYRPNALKRLANGFKQLTKRLTALNLILKI